MTLDNLAHACTCRSTLTSEPFKPSGPEDLHRYAGLTGAQIESLHRVLLREMADWGRRVDVVTWSFLGLNTCFWAVSLGGVAALSRVYNGPNSSYQVPIYVRAIY